MNKHIFSLSLAFGTAAIGVGLMAINAPFVLPVVPVAIGLVSLLGGQWGPQPFSGHTYFFAAALSFVIGATVLEGVSPGTATQYLSSAKVQSPISQSL
jgi:hypothetical protein